MLQPLLALFGGLFSTEGFYIELSLYTLQATAEVFEGNMAENIELRDTPFPTMFLVYNI